mmetsp:Transcript_24961/g.31140  ORF Transcript_24961/g.31140 Transcript_24961/m.31140 type:complete len:223 (-) Transcript_24961:496-1164(-)
MFQHGLLDSSDSWIINEADKAPAFLAADAGYDVWLGNLRGNKYSLKHSTLDSNDDAKLYWDFDIGHHERLDLVSMIDFIKQETGFEKIAYVGHSMGTTIMFRMAAENRTYLENNISTFVGLGPVVVPVNAIDEAKIVYAVMPVMDEVYDALTFFGFYQLGEPTPFSVYVLDKLCTKMTFLCLDMLTLIATNEKELSSQDRFTAFMGHYPSGGSLNVVFHFLQ